MSSYFSKLAARVTLGNVAPSYAPRSAQAQDPFEASSPPLASPAPEPSQTSLPSEIANTPMPIGVRDAPPHQKPIEPKTERTLQPEVQELPAVSSPIVPAKSVSEMSLEPTSKPLASDRVDELSPDQPVKRLERAKEKFEVPARSAPSASKEVAALADRKSQTNSDETNPRQGMEETQAMLLKADAFMSRIFARNQESEVETKAEKPEPRQTAEKLSLAPESPTRRPAAVPASRQFSDDAERPSLVIGKITVEVVPPITAPAPPPPSVVVVRGGIGRSAGLTSGRRFGLGQF